MKAAVAVTRINREARSQEDLVELLEKLNERYGGPAGIPDGVWDCFLDRAWDTVQEGQRAEEVVTVYFNIQDEWAANMEAD